MHIAETIQQISGSTPCKWQSYIKHTIISVDHLHFLVLIYTQCNMLWICNQIMSGQLYHLHYIQSIIP